MEVDLELPQSNLQMFDVRFPSQVKFPNVFNLSNFKHIHVSWNWQIHLNLAFLQHVLVVNQVKQVNQVRRGPNKSSTRVRAPFALSCLESNLTTCFSSQNSKRNVFPNSNSNQMFSSQIQTECFSSIFHQCFQLEVSFNDFYSTVPMFFVWDSRCKRRRASTSWTFPSTATTRFLRVGLAFFQHVFSCLWRQVKQVNQVGRQGSNKIHHVWLQFILRARLSSSSHQVASQVHVPSAPFAAI